MNLEHAKNADTFVDYIDQWNKSENIPQMIRPVQNSSVIKVATPFKITKEATSDFKKPIIIPDHISGRIKN